jgi:hypothetical protein
MDVAGLSVSAIETSLQGAECLEILYIHSACPSSIDNLRRATKREVVNRSRGAFELEKGKVKGQ